MFSTATKPTCRHLISLLLEVGIAEFQDHSKVDGFGTHAAWLLVEVHLLNDLQDTHTHTHTHRNATHTHTETPPS